MAKRPTPMTMEALQTAVNSLFGGVAKVQYFTAPNIYDDVVGTLVSEGTAAFIVTTDRHGAQVRQNIFREGSSIVAVVPVAPPAATAAAAAASAAPPPPPLPPPQQTPPGTPTSAASDAEAVSQRQAIFTQSARHAEDAARQRQQQHGEAKADRDRIAAAAQQERLHLNSKLDNLTNMMAQLAAAMGQARSTSPVSAAAAVGGYNALPVSADPGSAAFAQTPALWPTVEDPVAVELAWMRRYGHLARPGSDDIGSVIATEMLRLLSVWIRAPASTEIPSIAIGLLERQMVFSVNPRSTAAFATALRGTNMAPQFAKAWDAVKPAATAGAASAGPTANLRRNFSQPRPRGGGDQNRVPSALWAQMTPELREQIRKLRGTK